MNRHRNPEWVRQETLFKERERLTLEGYHKRQEEASDLLKQRKDKHRVEVLRGLIKRANPDKPASWKEARLRSMLGLPDPIKRTPTVQKKATTPTPARVAAQMKAYNLHRARQFGIKAPGEIQYR